MILHTSNGFEFDSERPKRLSFVLRYAGDNPKYNTAKLEYKPKELIKTKAIFRYVEGVTHGSATFLYSSSVFLDKSNSERYLESDTTTEIIHNNSNRLLRSSKPYINVEKSTLTRGLTYLPNSLWKYQTILLSSSLKSIWIERSKPLRKFIPQIWLESNEFLESFISNIYKEENKFLNRFILQIHIQRSQCLEYKKLWGIWIKSSQIINKEYHGDIDKSKSMEVIIDTPRLMFRVSSLSLQDMELRGLFKSSNFLCLHRDNLKYLNKAKYFISTHRENLKFLNKHNINFDIEKINLKHCDKIPEVYMAFSQIRSMSKDKTKSLSFSNSRQIDVDKFRLLSKSGSINMIRSNKTKGLKRVNLFRMLKEQVSKLMNYTSLVPITSIGKRKFISRVNEFRVSKFKDPSYLRIENILNFSKMRITKFLDRFNLTQVYKTQSLSVFKNILFPVYKKSPKALNKNKFNIYSYSQKSISKTNPFSISLNTTKISSLKIIKRWWVVSEGKDYDNKILPPDYDYENYPLVGSYGLGYERTLPNDIDSTIESMKLKYANTTGLVTPYDYVPKIYNIHPNITNPYMEHDDSGIGLYEIPLAINIMMEMVNLVGLIVHHQASQLCYCTGQEAMWLIMEMLDDWLNLESTIEELSRLDVTEQYHRAYRWIRWEAEKIYFDDRASNKFTGLKAGGQLLANLIEYMKLHHFNIVPMWKDLSRMDYWRNQSNRDNNPVDDISLKLDKLKGKRHLNIEAQKLDRRLNESIPKND